MEHLTAAVRVVTMLLEVLWQRGEISRKAAPIAIEIIQMQCVRTSSSQQGIAAGCAQRLLMWRRKSKLNLVEKGLAQRMPVGLT